MLTDKNDNNFLNALTDIDDELVKEIMEEPAESSEPIAPEIVTPLSRKSRFFKIAVPAAASLAVVAAVGIGAIIIGKNYSSPLGGTAAETTVGTTEEATLNSENETTPADSTVNTSAPDSTAHKNLSADDALDQEEWKDINHYHKIDVNDEESILRIPNFNDLDPKNADTQSGTLIGALFDIKKCGDCDIALLGFNVWTDQERLGGDIILAKELRVALVKDERIIASKPAYYPLDPDAPTFMLMKKYLDSYIEVTEFTETVNIAIFRSIIDDSPVPEALFFFIDGETMRSCERIDLGSNAARKDRSEKLSPSVSTATNEQTNPDTYIISDELTGETYSFYLIEPNEDAYYLQGESGYLWNTDGYEWFDPGSLPVIDDFTYMNADEIRRNKLSPPAIITGSIAGDYTLSLIGNNMSKNSEGAIYLYNPQIVISKNGDYIGSIKKQLPTNTKGGCAGSSVIYNRIGDYSDYGMIAFIIDDTLLIIDDSRLADSYFGEGCFYAVKNDDKSIYHLSGYWPGMTDSDPPAWTEGKEGYKFTFDHDTQTLIYGFMQFKFDLDKPLDSMYGYTVSWLEGPIE